MGCKILCRRYQAFSINLAKEKCHFQTTSRESHLHISIIHQDLLTELIQKENFLNHHMKDSTKQNEINLPTPGDHKVCTRKCSGVHLNWPTSTARGKVLEMQMCNVDYIVQWIKSHVHDKKGAGGEIKLKAELSGCGTTKASAPLTTAAAPCRGERKREKAEGVRL